MEQTLQKKPVHIFIPFAILVTALFASLIASVNKVELKAYETEYPQESFIAPGFKLPSLSGGNIAQGQSDDLGLEAYARSPA